MESGSFFLSLLSHRSFLNFLSLVFPVSVPTVELASQASTPSEFLQLPPESHIPSHYHTKTAFTTLLIPFYRQSPNAAGSASAQPSTNALPTISAGQTSCTCQAHECILAPATRGASHATCRTTTQHMKLSCGSVHLHLADARHLLSELRLKAASAFNQL
jgi:hypothetical protein